MYYNYHAKAKRLIREGRLLNAGIVDDWNGIRPALVLYFIDAPPMPIRRAHWPEYAALIAETAPRATEEERD